VSALPKQARETSNAERAHPARIPHPVAAIDGGRRHIAMTTSPMMSAPPRVDRLVHSEATTARKLGVPPSTLAKWRKAGDAPPHVLLGRRICYREADLEDWLLSRRRFPSEARKEQSGAPAEPHPRP
jgi:hypothetical protein